MGHPSTATAAPAVAAPAASSVIECLTTRPVVHTQNGPAPEPLRAFTIGGVHIPISGAPLCLEVCCGTAGLSRALSQAGFRAIGVDRVQIVHCKDITIIVANIISADVQDELLRFLAHPDLAYVHFAPPGGTASRARERPLPAYLQLQGWIRPEPLRSEQFPLGLPDLHPKHQVRVQAANTIYAIVAKLCSALRELSVPFTIENPGRSLFWYIDYIVHLLHLPDVMDCVFDSCMLGGTRAKRTRIRCFPGQAFQFLNVLCDQNHAHEPWGSSKHCGGWATSDESEYPSGLCGAIAGVIAELCSSRLAQSPPSWLARLHIPTCFQQPDLKCNSAPWFPAPPFVA